jgi:hypothetical protein
MNVRVLIAGLLSVCASSHAQAEATTLSAVADTYITEHPGLGGPNSTHGSQTFLWEVQGPVGGGFRTYPLVQFDLSSFAGQMVSGPTAEVRLLLTSSNVVPTQTVSIRLALVDWDEFTSTYANFGGTGFNLGTQVGSALSTRTVTFSGSPESIAFVIPSATVQSWIDNPSSNFGLIWTSPPSGGSDDLVFSSREGTVAPSLTFSLSPIPEPGAATLLLVGAALLLVHRARAPK